MTEFAKIQVFEVEFDGVRAKTPVFTELCIKKYANGKHTAVEQFAREHTVKYNVRTEIVIDGKTVKSYTTRSCEFGRKFVL